ncbi:DUF3467 domain-containing protein [Verrucomicrobiota bacterium sgz303538]
MSNVPNQPGQPGMNLQIRYEDMTARYANQVMLNTTAEECFFDFSSGVIVDRGTGGAVMPIHTRIVMNPNGMLRLYQLIGQALQNYQIVQNAPAPAPEAPQPVEAPASEAQS